MKRVTGRGIVVKDGQILLMERWRDGLHYFSIPGGGVEPGETIEQAAERELYEEMSIQVHLLRKVYVMKDPTSEHHLFLCEYLGGDPRLHPDSPEAADNIEGKNVFKPRWIPIEQFGSLSTMYWEPLQKQLAHDLVNGFADECKTVFVSGV